MSDNPIQEFQYLPIVSNTPQDLDMIAIFPQTGSPYKVPYKYFKTIVGGSSTISAPLSATTGTVPITFESSRILHGIQTGNINFVMDMTGAKDGAEVIVNLTGDSSHTIGIALENDANFSGNTPDNTKDNFIIFKNINGKVKYTINKSAIPDTTPPTFVSLVTNAAGTLITLTVSKTVGTQNVVFKKNGSVISVTPTLVGSTVQYVPAVALLNTDVLVANGTVSDSNSTPNVLTLQSDQAVTNNVSSYLFYDDFSGGNSTDIAGRTPTAGGIWASVAGSGVGGVIGIVSGKAKLTSANGTYIDYVAAISSGTNPVVECTVGTVGEGYDGFYPAWASNSNRLSVALITGAVVQVIGGSPTTLYAGSGTSIAGDIIKFDVANGNIYRNGVKLNGSPLTINSAVKGGYVGLSFFSSANTIDSVAKLTAQ